MSTKRLIESLKEAKMASESEIDVLASIIEDRRKAGLSLIKIPLAELKKPLSDMGISLERFDIILSGFAGKLQEGGISVFHVKDIHGDYREPSIPGYLSIK